MSHTNFLGIPVTGDISWGEKRPLQKPLSELEPLIRALLDDETIVEFGWRQYTPYFNDGDPCVFSTYGVWVRTVTDDKDPDDEDISDSLSVEYGHPSLGEIQWGYSSGSYESRVRFVKGYEGPDQARLERCLAFNDAIEGGSFDDVLLEAFGDHAEIRVKRDGITVEFFTHD